MRFALLGNHPDGLDLAGALVDSGRHELAACSALLDEAARQRLKQLRTIVDVEDILADPAIEAVIVASPPGLRPTHLRRALQSERHVLCVHPADDTPDIAYESSLLQRDTGYVLFPLLPEGQHPAIARLAAFIDRTESDPAANPIASTAVQRAEDEFTERPAEARPIPSPVGTFRLVQFERCSTGEVLDNTHEPGLQPSFPGWDVLRRLGGELIEVSSFADGEAVEEGKPILLAGRFFKGGLFQVTLLPRQRFSRWRLVVAGTRGQAELTFPQGWNGPAILEWFDGLERREEYFEPWDPWPSLVKSFESAVNKERSTPTWQDEVRALELDDTGRRSVERRRVGLMEYQEASEEVGFKGTMTLVGCGMLWAVLLLLIASRWLPWMGWLILPLLVAFIALQLLRYAIPDEGKKPG
jgi:hypothetical protein